MITSCHTPGPKSCTETLRIRGRDRPGPGSRLGGHFAGGWLVLHGLAALAIVTEESPCSDVILAVPGTR